MGRCTKKDDIIAKEVTNVGGSLTRYAHVPDEFRYLPNGAFFLQLQEKETHIYLSDEVVKLAIDAALYALIGDGIHQLKSRYKRGSRARVEEGQLYTIHGVCRGGIEAGLTLERREEDPENTAITALP
ncbi:unnamed protein product [Strongylus vulgaris]|uniref:Uncharacterized protein n=1 Tax=Strongylus vulgaris TaxID=40348 RepID=A0A3P7ITV2_STRVU|nr:unnamed protein product [Strongylus vulgaris]